MSSIQITMAMAIVTLALAMGLMTMLLSKLNDRVLDLEEKLEEKEMLENVRVYKKVVD